MRFKKGGTGMLTRMKTASLQGVNGYPVTVETDLHRGMPGFQIVGLADTTIKEAFSRIRPAIINSGYRFPREKVTVNLSPAGKPKEGSHFDLPIVLGILLLTLGEEAQIEDTAFFGELSLDGKINPIRGALPLALCARKAGVHNIVLPLSFRFLILPRRSAASKIRRQQLHIKRRNMWKKRIVTWIFQK